MSTKKTKQEVKYASSLSSVPKGPMQFISVDVIGEFHPKSSARNSYALVVICILTSYTFCIPMRLNTPLMSFDGEPKYFLIMALRLKLNQYPT